MDYPKKFLINYENQPVPVYVVGDIQYLYFVVRLPKEGEVHLNLDFEEDGKMKWVEITEKQSGKALDLGETIQRQMEKEGYQLAELKGKNVDSETKIYTGITE